MPKIVAVNKRAYHDYDILEKYEAGIVLTGKEVKAARAGKVSLAGGIAKILNQELWLLNCHMAGAEEPERTRKLLVHKRELKKLFGKTQVRGLYLIPIRMYFKNNVAKVELGIARPRKLYDKREIIKKIDTDRLIKRIIP
jgi:SsrA-binding protein